MDFFASQEAAQRSSRWLLCLFIVAVACICLLVNLAVYFILKFQTLGTYHFDQTLIWQINGGVLLLVIAGSAYRVYSLKRGGEAIAAALGGRLLSNGGNDPLEQRLVNVVEEMAIASGLPVPPVYLIDEEGINAFAAGFSSNDAVIGVTRGALKELTRDQLQGVVAHEFSHIIHGDMRLNIRLVGLLHGILMLSFAGKMLLQTRSGVARRSSAAFPVMFLGLSFFLIGAIGKFFGDLIKAGVSRQREYLADASAVQFTRNNLGIAGALKRIGGYVAGSNVIRPGAEEFSHLYFSNGSKQSLMKMLATHPPLADRIERLEPNWDGQFITQRPAQPDSTTPTEKGIAGLSAFASEAETSLLSDYVPESLPEMVGTLQSVTVASAILGAIPSELRQAVRETYSVRAVVYGLFLHTEPDRRETQWSELKQHADIFVRARLRELEPLLLKLDLSQRLPLLELAMPALHQLAQEETERLFSNIDRMLKAAAPIGLGDWALSYYLRHHMAPGLEVGVGRVSIARLKPEIEYLLSVLAHSDRQQSGTTQDAFAAGAEFFDEALKLQSKQEISIPRLETAIKNLNQLKPLQKPKVLKAFVAVIHFDHQLNPVEVELVRCIADAIDCPLPPLTGAAA